MNPASASPAAPDPTPTPTPTPAPALGAGPTLDPDEATGPPARTGTLHQLTAQVYKLTADLTAQAARLAVVEERVEDHAMAFDDIETAGQIAAGGAATGTTPDSDDGGPAGVDGASGEGGEPAPGLDMRRLVDWVRDNVALLLERKVPQTGAPPYWCTSWWLHPEAIARFEAARRTWVEAVSTAGAAMVVYFEHLDHQLAVLCGESGPFCRCSRGHSPQSLALGQDEPDESYFLAFDQIHDTPL